MSTQEAAQDIVPLGHRSTHFPAEQAVFAPHFTPHAPQLLGSTVVAMQALPQRVSPALQLKSQVPEAHTAVASAGAAHFLLHAPQLMGSRLKLTQLLRQRESPTLQLFLHTPA